MGLIDDPAKKQSVTPQLSAETISPKPIEQAPVPVQQEPKPAPPIRQNPKIGGIRLTDEQVGILNNDGYIFLENMEKKDGSGKYSGYIFLNDEKKRPFTAGKTPTKWLSMVNGRCVCETKYLSKKAI